MFNPFQKKRNVYLFSTVIGEASAGLPWHVDQNGTHAQGMVCAQGLVALTPVNESTGGLSRTSAPGIAGS